MPQNVTPTPSNSVSPVNSPVASTILQTDAELATRPSPIITTNTTFSLTDRLTLEMKVSGNKASTKSVAIVSPDVPIMALDMTRGGIHAAGTGVAS